jgi:hypothetical protein
MARIVLLANERLEHDLASEALCMSLREEVRSAHPFARYPSCCVLCKRSETAGKSLVADLEEDLSTAGFSAVRRRSVARWPAKV